MNPKNFKIEHLKEYCESGGSYEYYLQPKGPMPSSYLEFARKDLSDEDLTRSWVNAVSNAKRALHLQVEQICLVFGSEVLSKKSTRFPPKLDYLQKCGIVSPAILSKLNRIRNKVEHDYYFPTLEEAEDYVDIIELFIFATKNLLDRFPSNITFDLMEDEEYDVSLCLPKSIGVKIIIEKGGIEIDVGEGKREINIEDNDYFEWLSTVMYHYQL
ncbi:MAG: hypothetical protein V7731_11555 [Amphritea sp.]